MEALAKTEQLGLMGSGRDVNGATCSSLVKKLVNSEDFFWRTVNSVQDLAVKIGIFFGRFSD